MAGGTCMDFLLDGSTHSEVTRGARAVPSGFGLDR
jgi:hypothetical protein